MVVWQVKDFIRTLTPEANTSNLHLKASAAYLQTGKIHGLPKRDHSQHRKALSLCRQECHHILAVSSLLPLEINPRLQKSLVSRCYSLFCLKIIIKLSIKPMVTLSSLKSCCLSPQSAGTAGMSHICWLCLQVFCIKHHLS